MKIHLQSFLDVLRRTDRCRPVVMETAAELASLPTDQFEALAEALIEAGEDLALGILLLVATSNRVKLNPALLARALKVVEPLPDIRGPYSLQDAAAIGPLLGVALAEDISWERQVFAARLAAELALVCDRDRDAVRKVLKKLSLAISMPDLQWMIKDAESLLELSSATELAEELQIHQDVVAELPEEKPPVIIGGFHTVRRPVAKIGRNAPCPCGSGRKYKKCCLEKDQLLLRDASSYAGITKTQLYEAPGLVEDDTFIDDMRAYELKKLVPARMTARQLIKAYRRAELFGLYALALEMLLELKRREGFEDNAVGYLEDLLQFTLATGDLGTTEKILEHIPPDVLQDDKSIQFQMDLLKNPGRFDDLEARCRQSLTIDDDAERWNDALEATAHIMGKAYPAMSIVFARAAMMSSPERHFANEILLDVIRSARVELDLDPYSDPAEPYLIRAYEKEDAEDEQKQKDAEIETLRRKVIEAEQRSVHTARELSQKEGELTALEGAAAHATPLRRAELRQPNRSDEDKEAMQETISRLRFRIANLKAEVGQQQERRRLLRQKLHEEREKHRRQFPQATEGSTKAVASPPSEPRGLPEQPLVPDFSSAFRRACQDFPAPVVARALRAAVGFTLNDPSVWNHTQSIEKIPGFYRVRIGRHRLLLRWKPGSRLEVLDLIRREDFETWLRRRSS
ncbi:MAG: SEC-C metal-binding domain-containing protein [Desulfobacterales bacterium]